MSPRFALAALALIAHIPAAHADPTLAEQLRAVVRMPTWREAVVCSSGREGLVLNREMAAIDRQFALAALEALGIGDDTEHLGQLAGIARAEGRKRQCEGYLRMALALHRQTERREPDNTKNLIGMADTLAHLGLHDQAERVFDRVHQAAPRDPHLWRTWSVALWGRCCCILEKTLPIGSSGTIQHHAESLRSANVPQATRDEIRKLAGRARDYMDLAVLLGPDDPKSLHHRLLFAAHRVVFENAFAAEPTDPRSHPAMRQMIDDARRWADVAPDEPRVIAAAIWLEVDLVDADGEPGLPRWDRLPEAVQRSARRKLDGLAKLAGGLDLQRSFEATLMLGTIHQLLLEQPRIGSVYLWKAFAMRPDHPSTGPLLCGALADLGRWEAIVGVAENALRFHPDSVVLRSYLHEGYIQTRRDTLARAELPRITALKPAEPEEQFLLAAAWLRTDSPEALPKAKQCLTESFARPGQFRPVQFGEMYILGSIGSVLAGDPIGPIRDFLGRAVGNDATAEWAQRVHGVMATAQPPGVENFPSLELIGR